MVLACKMSNPGGGIEYDMTFYCAHRDFVISIR